MRTLPNISRAVAVFGARALRRRSPPTPPTPAPTAPPVSALCATPSGVCGAAPIA